MSSPVSLLEQFAALADRRQAGKVMYPLEEILLVVLCGTLAGIAPHQAVMIGDNPETDIAGAERLGLATVALSPSAGVTLQTLVQALDSAPDAATQSLRL